jgi:hypothetical protein
MPGHVLVLEAVLDVAPGGRPLIPPLTPSAPPLTPLMPRLAPLTQKIRRSDGAFSGAARPPGGALREGPAGEGSPPWPPPASPATVRPPPISRVKASKVDIVVVRRRIGALYGRGRFHPDRPDARFDFAQSIQYLAIEVRRDVIGSEP